MPFCLFRCNRRVTEEQERQLSEGIGNALPYGEGSLLLDIQDGCRMRLGGRDVPSAYVSICILDACHMDLATMTSEITDVISDLLHIDPGAVFLNFTDIFCFGAGGRTFLKERS